MSPKGRPEGEHRSAQHEGSSPRAAAIRRALPGDARAIAEVRVDAWRSTYRGMIPDSYLDAMKVEDSEALWQRVLAAAPNTTSVFVAVGDEGVIAFAAGMMLAEPRFGLDAELTAIYVQPRHQRTGIGRRLVREVVAAQRAVGATGVLTWVIAQNRGARKFYEGLGAELLVEQPFEWDGMDLVEAGYGWRDLDALAAAGGSAPTTQHP
jgi:GNAT superfamily N-acetyltransferase